MKLTLQINPKALHDPTKPLAAKGILITPPVGEDFWFYRVAVSNKQAIIGFPKFGVIGVGFQHEDKDWNTNLPTSAGAIEIYEHIRKNSRGASRARCIEAILMIQEAVIATQRAKVVDLIKTKDVETGRGLLLGYLRRSGGWEVAQAFEDTHKVAPVCSF